MHEDPIISHIENIERMTDLWPLAPETMKLLDLAKEAQRTGKMPDLSTLTPNTMTKLEAIQQAKQFRKDADELLQRMKCHKQLMAVQIAPHEERFADDVGEAIAQHTLSIRDLESCIMRQGMALKYIGNENPYPNSYDPTSKVVDPTADGLKL